LGLALGLIYILNTLNNFNFMQKVMVITGGSTGIGAATAKQAMQIGYKVVVSARSKTNLEKLKAEINNDNLSIFVSDVTDLKSLQALKKHALDTFGQVDIVFANAGFAAGDRSFLDGNSPDEWKDMVLTNVYGVALSANVFLCELVKTRGQLIITSSVVGRVIPPGSLYSATKWAVCTMGESIRKEMTGKSVKVTLIEPGIVDTPFWNEGTKFENALTADDVANTVIFATQQPDHVDINEILIRPIGQGI
jgi:NADP-dependent 3-hydroxy acid dehydrogenase YdfG